MIGDVSLESPGGQGYVVSFVLSRFRGRETVQESEVKEMAVTVAEENFLYGVESAVDLALSTPSMLPIRVAVTVPMRRVRR